MSKMGTADVGPSLIAELEEAIQSGDKDKRVNTLRRVTDLFVMDADRLNDRQIDVFDDVIGHLIKRIESKALAELSQRFAPIKNAPSDVVRQLARDDDITVAGPVLTQSPRLTDNDLIEIASTKTQAHLLAISGRSQIAETVTDTLLQRGDRQVFHKLAENTGAKFSEHGLATLVKQSEGDDHLSERIGLRLDVPLRLFRELLLRATEAVRSRLLAAAGPERRDQIQRALANVSEDVAQEARLQSEHDYAEAHARALAMRNDGRLDEAAIYEAAKAGRYADMVAALSLLCGTPLPLIDNLLQSEHREAFLVPCRAAGLGWPTVRVMLTCRSLRRTIADGDVDRARGEYSKLSQNSAQRVLRFWQVRQNTAKDGTGRAAAISPLSAPR